MIYTKHKLYIGEHTEMDSDYGHQNIPVNRPLKPAGSPPPQVEPTFVAPKKEPSVPYLAKLTAFAILFLSVLFSLSTLVNYLVEKLLIKQPASGDYSYFSAVDSFLVISSLATLIVALPASALLLLVVRRSESGQSWRSSQKWRRVIYTIIQIILIISVISALIGTVYAVFSHSLNLEVSSNYYGDDSPGQINPETGSKITAAIISGLAAVVIFVLGMAAFMSEYLAKRRWLVWVVLVLFGLTAAVAGTFSVMKVQEQIKKQNLAQPKYDSAYGAKSDGSVLDNGSDSMTSSASAKDDLKEVQSDLKFYVEDNNGKYPTKAQWDDSTFRQKYLFSDETTLKKITYTPAGCDAKGCASYSISMKDETGKTISLSSTQAG